MRDFEYMSVPSSIILGPGIVRSLSGIARRVRAGRASAPAWWPMVRVPAAPGFVARRIGAQAALAVIRSVVFIVYLCLLYVRMH